MPVGGAYVLFGVIRNSGGSGGLVVLDGPGQNFAAQSSFCGSTGWFFHSGGVRHDHEPAGTAAQPLSLRLDPEVSSQCLCKNAAAT